MPKLSHANRDTASHLLDEHRKLTSAIKAVGRRETFTSFAVFERDGTEIVGFALDDIVAISAIKTQLDHINRKLAKLGIEIA